MPKRKHEQSKAKGMKT